MWPFGSSASSRNAAPGAASLADLQARLQQAEAQREDALALSQRSAEEARYLQVRFDLITQGTSDGLWDMSVIAGDPINPANEFWWAPQFRRLLGFETEAEFPNVLDSWASRLHPGDKARALQAFSDHLLDRSGRTPYRLEYRLKRKDGSYRWFAAHGQTLRDAAGVPLRVAGSLTDIEDQRERARTLDVALTRFELSSAMLSDGLWDMEVVAGDPVNPKNDFWWAPQFRKLLGFETEAEFPNVLDSWASRLHPQDRERAMKALADHLNDRSDATPYALEYRLQHRSGEYRWFRARGQTRRAGDGTPLRVVGALSDIHASRQLAHTAEVIRNASREVSLGNADLSVRTEQQAAAIEETASAMEQMTGSVKQTSEHAQQASRLAHGAAQAAQRSSEVVGSVVATMAGINDSSRRISEIVSVIDGIAFQTNILALNAAVEAARAGEQGRGFAVVATEVRSLAQRCSVAAKDIRTLIAESSGKVGDGMALVDQAGTMMQDLLGTVRDVTRLVGGIAEANQQQTTGIEQISQAIADMDGNTQQNAAMVEEMAASARSLEDQADELFASLAVDDRSTQTPAKAASTASARWQGSPRVAAR